MLGRKVLRLTPRESDRREADAGLMGAAKLHQLALLMSLA
jgi:hypothetical protein